jgi:Ion channel
MAFVCALAGTFLVLLILMDTFEAMVLPRRISRRYRPTRLYYRLCWQTCCALVDRTSNARIRRALLGAFGPLSLFGLFGVWAAGLIVGFGLLHQAVAPSDRTLCDSLYLSGTTFTTLGYGDVNPAGIAGRILAIAEALVGFGFLAVVIGFLPVFYQAFSQRELTIALLDARAGSPPSAGQMLLRLPPRHGSALNRFLEEAEHWAAAVLESHLSYPVLSYYRSQHDNQSWLAAIICMLDASALLLTVAEGADRQQARLTFAMARHTIVDLALVLRRAPLIPADDRLPPPTLVKLLAALREVGVTVRDDDATRSKLSELRDLYEPFANALATQLRLDLPPVWREDPGSDNWQTTAWARKAAGFANLGSEARDEHDD